MRTSRLTVLILTVLLALSPVGLRAQEASPGAPTPGAQAPEGAPASGYPSIGVHGVQGQATGLPQRAAPPRTLRDYAFVFTAFAIAWLLLFGYVVSIGRRWSRVERELAARG